MIFYNPHVVQIHIPFSHHKIDMKAKGVVMVRASSSTGQTNVPLPVFSEPNAAPPVGQHGKFQLEMRHSHKALRTKSFKAKIQQHFHWPAFSHSPKEVSFHFHNVIFYPPHSNVGFQLKILCTRMHHEAFYITFTSDNDVQSITRKHPFC